MRFYWFGTLRIFLNMPRKLSNILENILKLSFAVFFKITLMKAYFQINQSLVKLLPKSTASPKKIASQMLCWKLCPVTPLDRNFKRWVWSCSKIVWHPREMPKSHFCGYFHWKCWLPLHILSACTFPWLK